MLSSYVVIAQAKQSRCSQSETASCLEVTESLVAPVPVW